MESCKVRRDPASARGRACKRGDLGLYPPVSRALARGHAQQARARSNEDGDLELANALLRAMHENDADFTLTFRRLCDAAADEKADANVRVLFANPAAYDDWAASWRWPLRLLPQAMFGQTFPSSV